MILHGDCLAQLKTLPDASVQCCVTSPPYWGLRDYGVDGQIGLESTPDAYVQKMVEVFSEVRRVLKDDGTCWVNLGDSYASDSKGTGGPSDKQLSNAGSRYGARHLDHGLKQKDLVGIPWRVAFALQQPYTVPTCVKASVDRAWLAAMFDGEGCIGIRRFDSYREEKQQVYQDGFVVYTVVTNNDVELLERCVEITGFGRPALKQAAESTDGRGIVSRRDSFGWRLDGNKAVDVIRAIYPYLIAKRKQACLAYTLDALNKNGHGSKAVPEETQDKKRRLWELIKKCNQREQIDMPDWIKEPTEQVEPGWYLRSDIIWHKPNPMPESVTDRPTKSHEYLFLLTKSERYYYDHEAIAELVTDEEYRTVGKIRPTSDDRTGFEIRGGLHNQVGGRLTKNKRTVWTIATQPYPEAHFATFPPKLIEPCILAGSRPGDVVLDPFAGSGTTLYVAKELGRQFIGIELNPAYIQLAQRRLVQEVLNL